MKTLTIKSKTYGTHSVLLDEEDFDRVVSLGSWHVAKRGRTFYAARTVYPFGGGRKMPKKLVYMHNFLLGGLGVDHVDGNGLNNQRFNLRLATQAQNNQNMQVSTRNKSGFKNVFWVEDKQRWLVNIRKNNRTIHIGFFEVLEDAVEAARLARQTYFTHANETRLPSIERLVEAGVLVPRVDHHAKEAA